MLDFLMISVRSTKKDIVEIYPKFIVKKSSDLMIRGGDFYAIWVEETGLWSTDEDDVTRIIDRELDIYAEENKARFEGKVKVLHMWDSETGIIDAWHKYCQKQMRDSFHMLDEKLIFSNMKTTKKDYASKKLSYPLEKGDISAYDKLMSTLYLPEEREKIEWAIGAIVSGESKKLQKFIVLYGDSGTGKSTVLNIIQQLFDGYYTAFNAKALGSANDSFALEAFKTNPLIAIQHDGDLSRIEDNTRLNSLVSHEMMTVNEKFKSAYSNSFKCFLFMGTNKPVKITDAKSGLIRRLIDVSPSGNKLSLKEYRSVVNQIAFELGAIAYYCKGVYESDPGKYDDYIPITMLGASNDFYNYISDSYFIFKKDDGTTLKAAWEMYRTYCDEAKVLYPLSQRVFKEELKNYFKTYKERMCFDDGTRVRSYYEGFKVDKFEQPTKKKKEQDYIIEFKEIESIFDKSCSSFFAQYASEKGTPQKRWADVTTILSDIDTSKLHYVKVPENHIVIDFDLCDENGQKDYERNLKAASKWPKTYAELSKSGAGIHLHYIYTGDPKELQRVYDEGIEIKVFSGKSSLRRKLTKCNDIPIATISSGLPLKERSKVVNFDSVRSEKSLRTQIEKNLRKEIHPATKPSIDFIYKILEDAYNSDLKYDVSDMRKDILAFAARSTHNADYCIKLVDKMKYKSEEPSENTEKEAPIIFYDIEVFPNLFLVNWKFQGKGKPVSRMINPTSAQIEELLKYRLIGFNCRRYDNHILYARLMGYTNEEIFKLSQNIVTKQKGFFGEAYNLSYTDVYDFASSANKKGLKKFEIELGITHKEIDIPWDQPVPEHRWMEVAEYCDNDVIATEKVFEYLSADWTARQILADIAGMTVNDTTNSLTRKIIFGNERQPQDDFNYRDLAKPVNELDSRTVDFLSDACPEMMSQTHGRANSLLPYFSNYIFDHGVSTYKNFKVGEGGFVYAVPGIHVNVALLDVASMHPHSIISEVLFGLRYTKIFKDLVDARVAIKHENWPFVKKVLNGKLANYIDKVKNGEITSKQLANALKTAINSVYGLTAAKFENAFKDIRNIDNIVAKRGALFMIDLVEEVQKKGFTVVHIKTDSIKISNATPEIISFVMSFGKRYGYTFEHEATYDRMCLVNDAVYIAKYAPQELCQRLYDYIPEENLKNAEQWTATGTQFQVPYVFKTLFSKEPVIFKDLCETKSVATAMYLNTLGEEVPDHFIGKVGEFCPVKDGPMGDLMREDVDKEGNKKYSFVTGTKGYKWIESETLREIGDGINYIDRSYYNKLANEAIDTISKYGDFDWFVSDNETFNKLYFDPPWKMECGRPSCMNCPNYKKNKNPTCTEGFDNSELERMLEK